MNALENTITINNKNVCVLEGINFLIKEHDCYKFKTFVVNEKFKTVEELYIKNVDKVIINNQTFTLKSININNINYFNINDEKNNFSSNIRLELKNINKIIFKTNNINNYIIKIDNIKEKILLLLFDNKKSLETSIIFFIKNINMFSNIKKLKVIYKIKFEISNQNELNMYEDFFKIINNNYQDRNKLIKEFENLFVKNITIC